MADSSLPSSENDIAVLREMVRISEMRRSAALEMIERINKYNLAIIAFSGSFLSVLVTADLNLHVLQSSGICLVVSILIALCTIRPVVIQSGGSLDISDDVVALRNNQFLDLSRYLLDVADLTNISAVALQKHATNKKKWTIISALFLASSLITAYILSAYA